jgi:hypothetical protein
MYQEIKHVVIAQIVIFADTLYLNVDGVKAEIKKFHALADDIAFFVNGTTIEVIRGDWKSFNVIYDNGNVTFYSTSENGN